MAPTPASLHTVFTSECNNVQFDWFATGVFESFRTSGMRGKITRLLACSDNDLKTYKGMGIGPTFVHPNYRHNPINSDTSASYNKPGSVMHFSRSANFTEDYLLFIDADMLLKQDVDPIALGAKPGTVVSEEVGYMIGTHNEMAANFLTPEAVPLAKPVGWYHIFYREDIQRIAPLWLEFCGKVRMNPQLYWSINGSIPHDIPTGDAYAKHGQAPWISEMYGYAFGAATAGVQHVITHGVVMYPSNTGGRTEPHIIHYGIDFNIGANYNWNKMVYKKFDISKCQGRYFQPPPKPTNRRETNCAWTVNTLNAAICKYYAANCADPPACPATERSGDGLVRCAPSQVDCCEDKQTQCWAWSLDDQCENNPGFMKATCPRACGLCADQHRRLDTAAATATTATATAAAAAAAADVHDTAPKLLPAAEPHAAAANAAAASAAATATATPEAPPPAAEAEAAAAAASADNSSAKAEPLEGDVAPSHASPKLAGDTATFAPVYSTRAHDAPALEGIHHDGVAPVASARPSHAPAHVAPQMIGRAQARKAFVHAPGSSPTRAPGGHAPDMPAHQPAMPAHRPANKALLPDDGDAAAAEPGGGGDGGDAKAEREAAQYRLMVTQVAFWVVVIGLFFGRFVVCPRRPRRKGEKLLR